LLAKDNHGLKLQRLTWGPEQAKVYCEMSTDAIRPYLPKSLRERVFGLFHSVSHPGAKSSVRLVRQRYVWPHMHRDIARWCKNCLDCQKSKITRHNKLTPSQFVAPDGRFEHVHIDIVIMPDDGGYRYCLTMIDRFTRWPEAVPMRNMEASTVARVFYDTWVARFGAPTLITTDQGAQFESQLFDALLCLIGTKRMRTTAYHPQSNGLIERWHRDVKAAIMCHNKRWTKVLSTVLLGLRTRVRLETDCSPADLLYARALKLPGEFVLCDDVLPSHQPFLSEFRDYMREVRPVPVERKDKRKIFFFKDLATCTHVLLLTKREIKVPLERPYKGPYKVLERVSDRVYKIDIDGRPTCVTVDRLKPAYFIPEIVVDELLSNSGERQSVQPRPQPVLRRSERLKKSVSFDDRLEIVA